MAFMINSEIGAVLTVMRRNVKWGAEYGDEDQLEHPLIYSLKVIRKNIFSWQHQWHYIHPIVYIKPFLDVIQSDETGPSITGVALSSVHKILTLGLLDDLHTVNAAGEALHQIVDAVTICRFEVTDSASEEAVLMKILQVLLACVKIKASVYLSHYHVCNIVTTCFRIVRQASSKSELLQKIAHHTMNELIWCIFSRLPDIDDEKQHLLAQESRSCPDKEVCVPAETYALKDEQNVHSSESTKSKSKATSSEVTTVTSSDKADEGEILKSPVEFCENEGSPVMDPYGVPCIIEVFQYLCSLLSSIEGLEPGSRSNLIPNHEDVPLLALGLINTAIELSWAALGHHPKFLSLIQEELFYYLMQFGLSNSPQVFSTVCSIVLNLYHLLRDKLKLQLEAFFSGILLRVAGNEHGSSYQLWEVAMEALVDFCRQDGFVTEMYANFNCDISCNNVFQDIVNLLSKSAFPVSSPLAAINTLARDGLLAMVQGMAERVAHESSSTPEMAADFELQAYEPFWKLRCENHNDPTSWVPFARKMNQIKRKLMVGVDHFNQDSRKGFEFLQDAHLLPELHEPKSIACFLRFANGLDKNRIGDFVGGHDEFRIQVLHEFVRTFDFQGMNLDTALRIFLETFRLPGEAQKIQRVLEAFSDRYYEQSPDNFDNRDATLLLSYSLILLNTDQHNAQVKKKMTEEDFIRNNHRINGGNDLPRELLSELYHAICKNEIKMVPEKDAGFTVTTRSHWIALLHKSKQSAPYIGCDTGPYLDYDMFSLLSGPSIAAISVIFDHVEQDDVLQACIDGFLSIAKISAAYDFIEVIDDLVVSLSKCTNLLLPLDSDEDFIQAFGDDTKVRMSVNVLFNVANGYGDYIRSGWQNIVDCILRLNNLGILPSQIAIDAADQHTIRLLASSLSTVNVKSSGLMGRFSQFLYLDAQGKAPQPTLEQLAARERTLHIIQDCHIDSIFAESKFLQDESLAQLVQALLMAASRPDKNKNKNLLDNETSAVLCLELLVTITLNNRDRIMLLWEGIYEHIVNIVESTVMPCALVEKAVFGLLRICQRLLPYKESLTDELLNSLQLILKLDARVAEAYCEQITLEVMHLVRTNVLQIRSLIGWRTIISLLSITARHPEASEAGFGTLSFLMADGAHLSPVNYVLCVNAAKQFAGSRVGNVDRSIRALNLMAGSLDCLVRWFYQTKDAVEILCEMWLRLIQGLKEVSIDPREEVRNEAILALQRCLTSAEVMHISGDLWLQCYDLVIFTLINDLLEIAQQHSRKDYRNMEDTLLLSLNFSFKVFLLSLQEVSKLPSFSKLWLGMLICFERYTKVKFRGKRSERINELVPELLKNTLFVMISSGILLRPDEDAGDNNIWQLSWSKINDIAPHLLSESFLVDDFEQLKKQQMNTIQEGTLLVPPGKTAA